MLKIGDTVRVKTKEEFSEIEGYNERSDGSFYVFVNGNGWFKPSQNKYCNKIFKITWIGSFNWLCLEDTEDDWKEWMFIDISKERKDKILEVLNA